MFGKVFFAVLIAMLMTGCATTTNISSVWKDRTYNVRPHKIMIIGIAKKPSNKRFLEDEFVRLINVLGTEAVSSYAILSNNKDSNKDAIAEKMKEVGGIDSAYGGIGYRGHIAFNEPPRSPWYRITTEQFRDCTTRILHLNDDTLIAISQRAAGGCSDIVPPLVVTLGMRELLSAKRIRLYSETGAWKQTVIRILLFGNVSPEIPVTYCQKHADCMVTVDAATAACPPLGI